MGASDRGGRLVKSAYVVARTDNEIPGAAAEGRVRTRGGA
jgi:hypothetical protein